MAGYPEPCALCRVSGEVSQMGVLSPCGSSPQSLGLAEEETEEVPPRSEEEPQSKQQETISRLPGEPEKTPPTPVVQLGLLRAETDR